MTVKPIKTKKLKNGKKDGKVVKKINNPEKDR